MGGAGPEGAGPGLHGAEQNLLRMRKGAWAAEDAAGPGILEGWLRSGRGGDRVAGAEGATDAYCPPFR